MDQTGHKEHASGVVVPSPRDKTGSLQINKLRTPLIRRDGELYFHALYAGRIIVLCHIYRRSVKILSDTKPVRGSKKVVGTAALQSTVFVDNRR